MIYYSKSKKGFFHEELHGKNIPSDCVIIDKNQYDFLFQEQSKGKEIVPDENGHPVAIIPSSAHMTWEQIKAERNALLRSSDWIGLPNSPIKNKEEWLSYRQSLRDIPSNFSTPEAVVWPKRPN